VVEHLPSKSKVLALILRTAKTKTKPKEEHGIDFRSNDYPETVLNSKEAVGGRDSSGFYGGL
jgi:hypothetical protein